MDNASIAATFDLMADLLEFDGANPFRVRAYRNASRTIHDWPEPIAGLVDEPNAKLTDIPGIGKDLADKCTELVRTGTVSQLDELRQRIPASVIQLVRVPGLGPKRAAILFRELGIENLQQLKEACTSGRVRALKGFGAKSEQTIMQGIDLASSVDRRIYWCDADQLAQSLLNHLRSEPHIKQLDVAGSYRRGKETVGDLDILAIATDGDRAMDHLAKFPEIAETIARGPTKMSVRLKSGLQIDLRIVPPESFGAALQYFTGSKEHNVILRGMAKQHGLKINEYGVYRTGDNDEVMVAGATEADVYGALGLPVFPPEMREGREEYSWAAEGKLPVLIEEADICGDLHMHTDATDGKETLEGMIRAAQARGLQYIAITDHSQRVSMARGLDPTRLLKQWKEIDEWNDRLAGAIQVLKGIECDILEKGGLDLPDDVLAQADWVLASVHYGQQQPRAQITERVLQALQNTYVSALAHPTGRILNRREAYEIDMDQVFAAAVRHGKLLELNANPARLDLNDVHCAAAKRWGIPIVINTDAHSADGLRVMRYGILQARRGGLAAVDVANTEPWQVIKRRIGRSPIP